MATVNKDFRIKAGLVVEGANATVNGEDIITTGSTTDSLPEGATNKYYSTTQAKSDAADLLTGATLTNITITGDESGLIITAENGGIQDLTGFDTDDLSEGTTNKYFTNQRALDATASAYDPAGSAATAEQNANDYTDTAIGNLPAAYITSTTSEFSVNAGELSLDQLNGLTQVNPASGLQPNNGYGTIEYVDDTDPGTEGLRIKSERGWVGSQIGGQLDLDAYRDVVVTSRNGNIIFNPDGDVYLGSVGTGNDIATTGYVDGLASNYDPAGSASTAESNANTYTDTALQNYTPTADLDTTVGGYGYLKSADLSGYATETYVNTAVSNLVDGAPGLLDTLNELAAAINDDESFASTIATQIGEKQNTLTAGTNISIVADTISVTGLDTDDVSEGTNLYFTNQRALDATSAAYEPAGAAQAAVDALDTDDIEEGTTNKYFTDARAVDALEAVVPNFTAVEVNSLAKQVATTAFAATAKTETALSWSKTDYKSAKLIVKAATTTDSQVSEIIVTLDSSDNVAITEFGIVYTDEELATVTADIDGITGAVRIRVTTLNASTTITVVGTLLV